MFLSTHLAGFMAAVPAVGGLTLSFIASTTATDSTPNAPATVNAGDLLVCYNIAADSSATPSTAIPSGFTSISNVSDGTFLIRSIWSYKIAVGDEDGDTFATMIGDAFTQNIILQFRGSSPIASVTAGDIDHVITDSNPAAQTLTANLGTPPLIAFGGYNGAGAAVSPRTFTPAEDGEVSIGTTTHVKYKIFNTGPVSESIDMDDELTNTLSSFYLQCS